MSRQTIDNNWGSAGSAIDPGAAKINAGWGAEIPPFETQNFWQLRVDEILGDAERNGFMTWETLTVYEIGSWSKGSDNESYKSITATNTGNDPVSSPINWVSLTDLVTAVQATETTKGIAEIATLAETQAGTDDTRIVTPKKLSDAIQQVVPDASSTTKGKIELATNTEVQTGTDTFRAVTPSGLASVTATETRAGLVERATDAEVVNGTDTTRYVNVKQMTDRINSLVPTATETVKGKVELATQTEANTGTDNTRVITPLRLTGAINNLVPQATETVAGKAELATQAETDAGVDDLRVITPKKLRFGFNVSLASNGFISFPTWMGGLIVQWGTNNVGGNQDLVVSLPTTFLTAGLVSVCSYDSSKNDLDDPCGSLTPTTTTITLANGQNAANNIAWIAIGH